MWFISVPLLILILLVVGITVLVVKAGSVALRLTGMDESRANFQAISAVTGTGFTTRESELVAADPTRRKIVSFLMVFGNVVIVMLISLLVGSFAAVARTVEKWYLEYGISAAVLIVGGLLLYLVLRSRGLTQRWNVWVNEKLTRRLKLRERPVAEVLALAEGHGVAEIRVEAASPCAGKALAQVGLRGAGLLVLAIRRGEEVLPSPSAAEHIRPGDHLICYGELSQMHDFAGAEPEEIPETPEPTETPPQGT
jgi:hypothetical protein